MRKLLACGALAVVLATAPAAGATPGVGAAGSTHTSTPIKHFIYLMQENHSFDNYFGTYPGADGIPPGTCVPVKPGDPAQGCVKPFRIGNKAVQDLGHSSLVFDRQFRDGANDGFVDAFRQEGNLNDLAMGYYDGKDIPYYWNLADEYVLFDRFFTSARGGSVWNHMFWVTGTSGGPTDSIPAEGFGDLPTIFDRLEAKGISWKFYIQNYDPAVNLRTYRTIADGDRGAQVVWAPLLAYARYIDDPELSKHIVPLEQYYEDLATGQLPSVSYVVPSGASEHPPGSIKAGERFVRSLHTALLSSSAWSTSAFLWTYDDWGGWYDHVPPPQVDRFGFGFRAPALLVSPYAKQGFVDSTVLDFTSGLKFIEENWGVEPLAERDAKASNFLSAFDFGRSARPPVLLAADRAPVEPVKDRRALVYSAYGAAVTVPALLMALAGRGEWVRRRRGRGDPGIEGQP